MNIPQDWSKLSDEEALKYIAYLQKHSYKYKITADETGCIHIGTLVDIRYGVKKNTGSCVVINNKEFYCQEYHTVYDDAYDLYRKAEHKSLPFKTRAKEWWEDEHERVIGWTALAAFVSGMVLLGVKADKQYKREKEQFKQEIIKEALKQFKQEQQAIQYPVQNVR